jgi:hypothetical protein
MNPSNGTRISNTCTVDMILVDHHSNTCRPRVATIHSTSLKFLINIHKQITHISMSIILHSCSFEIGSCVLLSFCSYGVSILSMPVENGYHKFFAIFKNNCVVLTGFCTEAGGVHVWSDAAGYGKIVVPLGRDASRVGSTDWERSLTLACLRSDDAICSDFRHFDFIILRVDTNGVGRFCG